MYFLQHIAINHFKITKIAYIYLISYIKTLVAKKH